MALLVAKRVQALLLAARAARRAGDHSGAAAAIRRGERELVVAMAALGHGTSLVDRQLFQTYEHAARAMAEARADLTSRGVDEAVGLLAPLSNLAPGERAS